MHMSAWAHGGHMPPSGPVRVGFGSGILGQLIGHVSRMYFFDGGWVVVVRGHCRNLEVVPRHAMSRRTWGGGRDRVYG